ncbi:MAG: pyridoxal phosphate-dependent aminotransferase family protein [Deltaproteobacteria bacterium]
MFDKRIKEKLKWQQNTGLYRQPVNVIKRNGKYILTNYGNLLNFASNDYLGLGSSEVLREKVANNFMKYGSSSSSSRLVSGNFNAITEAEQAYANYFGYESALFFPSGYQANIGLISALFEKRDTLIFDKHIHASLLKGIQLSGASLLGFNHNRMKHLEKRIISSKTKTIAVVSESLFSMDGDFLCVQDLLALKKKYNFFTIIDEAHAFGVLGTKGQGIAREVADIAVGTFGKAFGLFGAMVLLSQSYRDFLLNFSSPQIYTTTLPEAHGASALDALHLIEKSNDKRDYLLQISKFARSYFSREGFKVRGDAHIVALEIGNEDISLMLSRKLLEKNFFVFPARFPTVPMGKAILRIGLTSLHDEKDIINLSKALKESYAEIEKNNA